MIRLSRAALEAGPACGAAPLGDHIPVYRASGGLGVRCSGITTLAVSTGADLVTAAPSVRRTIDSHEA
jgi:hypothetical protein